MNFKMKLKDPHFNNVLQKKKIYEIRLYDEKRKNMNIGDEINIIHNDDSSKSYNVIIIEVKVYKSFKKAIEDSGFKNVIPDAKDFNEALQIYMNIPGYSDNEEKFGVVRFKLQLQN